MMSQPVVDAVVDAEVATEVDALVVEEPVITG